MTTDILSTRNPQVNFQNPIFIQSISTCRGTEPPDKKSDKTNQNKIKPAAIAAIDINDPLPGRNLPKNIVTGKARIESAGISQAALEPAKISMLIVFTP